MDVLRKISLNSHTLIVIFVLALGSIIFTKENFEPNLNIRFFTISVVFIGVFLRAIFDYSRGPKLTVHNITVPTVFLFFFSYGLILSAFTSINFLSSIHYGLRYGFLFACIIGFVILLHKSSEEGLFWIFRSLVILMIFHICFGIVELIGLNPLNTEKNRLPAGLFFNRNLLSSYLVLLSPTAFIVALIDPGKSYRRLGVLTFLLFLVFVVISTTRSSWIAIGVSYLSLLFIFNHSSDLHKYVVKFKALFRKYWIYAIISVILLLAITYLTNPEIYSLLFKKLKEILFLQKRMAANSSVLERFTTWKDTIKIIRENFYSGIGFGNWPIIYPEFVSPLHRVAGGSIYPGRVHNNFLEILVETGIFGLSIFTIAWVFVFKEVHRAFSIGHKNDKIIVLGILAALISCTISQIFTFDLERPDYLILLAFYIALLIFQLRKYESSKSRVINLRSFLFGSIIILAVVGFFFGQRVLSQYYIFKSYEYLQKGDKEKVELLIEKSKEYSFAGMNSLGNTAEFYAYEIYEKLGKYELAFQNIEKAHKSNPNKADINLRIGNYYFKKKNYEQAKNYYERTVSLAPFFSQALRQLGLTYFQLGKYQKCLDILVPLNGQRQEPELLLVIRIAENRLNK